MNTLEFICNKMSFFLEKQYFVVKGLVVENKII